MVAGPARAFLVVMDSVGLGGAPDADRYFNGDRPDTGSNTLAHIAQSCATGQADTGRTGPVHLPRLAAMGLGEAITLGSGADAPGLGPAPARAFWGVAEEISRGKDTPSGHWELAGLPVPWDWHYFPSDGPAFSPDLVARVCEIAGCDGILGNELASGTEIVARLGTEHLRTERPICYSSADSVFQIAAHEESFGLDRLIHLCAELAPDLHRMRVGRVIARPFIGSEGAFTRTASRRDFAHAPPGDTLLDAASAAGRETWTIGKISDIFAGRGVSRVAKGPDAALMGHLADAVAKAPPGSLTFANFVEFDSLFGHRRDVAGYARHLEWFDAQIGLILDSLRADDLLILTADHGNDPTWSGTDHTRERVPILAKGPYSGAVGLRGFADIAASVAEHLGLAWRGAGQSFLPQEARAGGERP